eukprot:8226254-Pyramimonas_sp.AAC.1
MGAMIHDRRGLRDTVHAVVPGAAPRDLGPEKACSRTGLRLAGGRLLIYFKCGLLLTLVAFLFDVQHVISLALAG